MSPRVKYRLISVGFIAAFNFGLASCQKSEKSDLKDTQLCLNTAEASQAMGCLDKIASNNSPEAFKLRCAAAFISEGFNKPTSFTNALDSLNNNQGSCTTGCSSTVDALKSFNFKSAGTVTIPERTKNNEKASLTFSYCAQSETKIYLQIASLFKLGTMSSMIAIETNGDSYTTDELQTAIGTLPSAEIGSIVNTTYNSTCLDTEKANDAIKKYCEELKNSIDLTDGSDVAVGSCLKIKLADPQALCP